jgi:hypothetical protein
VLGLAVDDVLFVEYGFGVSVVELESGVDLAAALDGLLVEFGSAALFAVERGLEAVADVEEQVDRANRVGVGGDALKAAVFFEVEDGGASGKDAPVNRIGERLLLREGETRTGRIELGNLLADSPKGRCKGAEDASSRFTNPDLQAELLALDNVDPLPVGLSNCDWMACRLGWGDGL